MRKIFIATMALLITSTSHAYAADVVVNEFSALSDPDWVEIYNTTGSPINIEDWIIKDSTESNKIDMNGYICAGSYRKFDFSNRLNNSGDTIRLFDSESASNPIDEIIYFSAEVPQHQITESTSRQPDGANAWQLLTTPTPEDDTSCNLASPSPQMSPSPTPSPSPSSSSTLTKKSPNPTPKSSPKSSPSASSIPQVLGEQKDIADGFADLAASGNISSPSPTPSAYYGSITKNLSLVLIGVGTIFVGISVALYMFYKKNLVTKDSINKGSERFGPEDTK